MRKLFGREKNTADYDEWDDLEMIEDGEDDSTSDDAEEYYADEDGEEYYADEEGGEYYESEEEEFYAEGEEYYQDEYSDEETDAEERSDEDLEEMSEDYEDGSYDDEDDELPWKALTGMNLFEKMWYKLSHMSVMDRVMVTTGVFVLILAMVTGVVYGSSRIAASQVSSFDKVGTQLDGITVIGESGLLAVGDAELARLEAADLVDEDDETVYDEEDYSGEVAVTLNMTSIMKDLKIKFVNKHTGKLIANVPFSVSVKAPDGTISTWTDDDMDGIIYKKNIPHGNYVVELQELTGEKYADYSFETGSQSVKVKENIEYEKVDVSDEIKSEAEVDADKEDTKQNETEEESKLKDTVTFVETSKTYIGNTYKEVSKTAVTDPMKLAYNGVFVRLTASGNDASGGDASGGDEKPVKSVVLNPASLTGEAGGTASITATTANIAEGAAFSWASGDANVATVSGSGAGATVTFVGAGSTTITCTVDGISATCSVTVTEKATPAATPGNLSIKEQTLALVVNGGSKPLTLQWSDYQPNDTAQWNVTWTSSKPEVATVNEKGEVTPKAAGETEIKVTVTLKIDSTVTKSATSKVTVSAARTMTFDYTTANAFIGTNFNLIVHPNPAFAAPKAEQFKLTSSDNSIATATLSADFKTVTVKPLKKGEVTITLTYQENASAPVIKTECKLTVKDKDPTKDTVTRLKDTAGNELWVLVDAAKNEYREAVYADYYKYDKFYIKSGEEYKYTGWQTINGKVYYYKADGKYVTGEQVIQGARYNFASDGTLVTGSGVMGIDVSKWNGSIDWKAVKNSGVSYVIIRCGYRGSSAGALIEDPKFKANIKGATDAGLKVGVYFFSQAVDEVEAVEEASMVLSLIKNYKISYPVYLDVEASGGRADGISKETRTAVIRAFCETIQNSGYTAGVYANKSWLTTKIDTSQLSRYKIWLAQYASKPTYKGRYDMWQYTSKGRINGISGDVDLNLSYLGY